MKRSNFERFVDVFDADLEVDRLHQEVLTIFRAWPLPHLAPASVRAQLEALYDAIDARAVALRGLGTTKNPGGVH